mmetsp:Transcript_8977/g.13305  ORF Transcript_8977/g.13305 Transcript_8977/m.13305 type:complete len:276 (-) Transcript_8977:454-1281(-)
MKDKKEKERRKAKGVEAQRKLYSEMMRCRILLQKPLHAVNALPKGKQLKTYPSYQTEGKEVTNELIHLYEDMIELGREIYHQNEQMIQIDNNKQKQFEKIYTAYKKTPTAKKRQRLHETTIGGYQKTFPNMIGKFVGNKAFSNQFKKEKKARIQKVIYESQHVHSQMNLYGRKRKRERDTEIYNDQPFYQTMLQDFILESTTTTPTNVMKNNRPIKKLKKMVAYDKRSIRYDVHPEIVGFMAANMNLPDIPVSATIMYKKLFGKSHVDLINRDDE